jgi:hypothetical protein
MSFVRHPNEDKSLFPGYELSSVTQITLESSCHLYLGYSEAIALSVSIDGCSPKGRVTYLSK